jgi:hypothetical protein
MRIAIRRILSIVCLAGAAATGIHAEAHPAGGGRHFGHHHHHVHGGFGFWGGFVFAPWAYPAGSVAYPGGYAVDPGGYAADGGAPTGEWLVLPRQSPGAPPRPETAFVPRAGQDAVQREADRRACDREAMTRPDAMADAAVFHRAVIACMETRGYGVVSGSSPVPASR